MMFLLRVAFWFGVVLVLLPSGGAKDTPRAAQGSAISATEAVTAASATVSDMSHFCSRQPEACAVGAQAAAVLGQRAQAGAKMVYDFVNERRSQQTTGSVATGGPAAKAVAVNKPSQNTLTASDVTPPWRAPSASHKEAQGRNPVPQLGRVAGSNREVRALRPVTIGKEQSGASARDGRRRERSPV
jgi:hypothetical protein